jgi:hypothetical protein
MNFNYKMSLFTGRDFAMSNICKVTFQNGTPQGAGVTIVEVGAKWWFKDITGQPTGQTDQDSRRTHIEAGGQDELVSSVDECCYQVLCIMDVELSNGQGGRLMDRASSGANKCLIHVPFGIVPRAGRSLSLIEKKGTIGDFLKDFGDLDVTELEAKIGSLEEIQIP